MSEICERPLPPRLATRLFFLVVPHATPVRLVVCGLLWVSSALLIVAFQGRVGAATGGLTVPDVLPFYTPDDLYALLDRYGEAGRRAFVAFALFDVIYPFIAYGFAAIVLVSLTRPRLASRPGLARLILLPVAGLLVEVLEQAGFLLVLLFFPMRLTCVAWATSGLTVVKLGLLLLLLLVTTGLLAWRAWPAPRRF